jgi:hypothetical protein
MNATETKKRFEAVSAVIADLHEGDCQHAVIVDRFADDSGYDETVGEYSFRRGWIRCTGRYLVGIFGEQTPVYGGDPAGIYYAEVSCWNGEWSYGDKHVSPQSGRGQLWQALENFSESQGIAAA